jgi:hypothetical protein
MGSMPPGPGVRGAGACFAAAGAHQLVLGATAGAFPLAATGFSPWMALSAVGLLLLAAGLAGLAATELAGPGWLGLVGPAVAIAGTLTDLLAHTAAAIDAARSLSPLFPVGAVGTWAGAALTGAAVLRARRWAGWGRWLPLACGLYPFAAVLPAYLVGSGPAGHLAGAGLGALWIAAGAALARTRRTWLPPAAPTALPGRTGRPDDPARPACPGTAPG